MRRINPQDNRMCYEVSFYFGMRLAGSNLSKSNVSTAVSSLALLKLLCFILAFFTQFYYISGFKQDRFESSFPLRHFTN